MNKTVRYLLLIFLLFPDLAHSGLGNDIIHSFTKADFRPVFLSDTWAPIDPFRDKVSFGYIRLPAQEKHPSLYFTEDDIHHLRSRVNRSPMLLWYNRIQQKAVEGLSVDFSDRNLSEMDRALYAEALAFEYLISSNESYRHRAVSALRNISDPPSIHNPEGGRPGDGFGDFVYASQVILVYLSAYDMIQPYLIPEDDKWIRDKLAAEINQLYTYLPIATPNNHKTVMAAAVGLGAITLSNMKRYRGNSPQQWMDAAIEDLEVGLSEIAPDGSYKEGPFYAEFIAQQTFPFFIALRNTTGYNAFHHWRIQKFCDFLAAVKKPSGKIGLWDDSNTSAMVYHPFIPGDLRRSKWYQYDFDNYAYRDLKDYNLAAAIASYEKNVISQPNNEPAQFFPDGGIAVFKPNSSNRLYGLLLGEPKSQFSTGHEHVDPGHITLSALGTDFLIAPGYGPLGTDSEDRGYYLLPESYNIITINGRGPNRNPIISDIDGIGLRNCFSTETISSAEVIMSYRGADISRRLFSIDNEFFLLMDDITADDSVRIGINFHTSLKEIEALPYGFAIHSGEASLDVHHLTPISYPEVNLGFGVGTPNGNRQIVTRTIVSEFETDNIAIPTLLLPKNNDKSYRVLEEQIGNSARVYQLRTSFKEYSFIANPDKEELNHRDIISDAEFVLTDFRSPESNFVMQNGSYLDYRGEIIIDSDTTIGLYFRRSHSGGLGYMWGPDTGYTVKMFLSSVDPGPVFFNDIGVAYEVIDGFAVFELRGSGTLKAGFTSDRITTVERYRRPAPLLPTIAQPWNRYRYPRYLNPAQVTGLEMEIADTVVTTAADMINSRLLDDYPYTSQELTEWGISFAGQFDKLNVGIAQETSNRFYVGDMSVALEQEGVISEKGLYMRRLGMEISPGENYLRLNRRELVMGGYDFRSEYWNSNGVGLRAGTARLYGNDSYSSGISYHKRNLSSNIDLIWDDDYFNFYSSIYAARMFTSLSGTIAEGNPDNFHLRSGYSYEYLSPFICYSFTDSTHYITGGSRFHPDIHSEFGISISGEIENNLYTSERFDFDFRIRQDRIFLSGFNTFNSYRDDLTGHLISSYSGETSYYTTGFNYLVDTNKDENMASVDYFFAQATERFANGNISLMIANDRRLDRSSRLYGWSVNGLYSREVVPSVKAFGGTGFNLTDSELSSVSTGVSYYRTILVSADANLILNEGDDMMLCNYAIGYDFFGFGRLDLGSYYIYSGDFPELEASSYQFKLSRQSRASSPGIIYGYDRMYGRYVEGYISFSFN
ncbi:MAG: hypothetical protein GF315_08300 [candidate division Zixibacteria bacterium]|nr:hypothetical protein [candidate division Zixibacteria bacterium]